MQRGIRILLMGIILGLVPTVVLSGASAAVGDGAGLKQMLAPSIELSSIDFLAFQSQAQAMDRLYGIVSGHPGSVFDLLWADYAGFREPVHALAVQAQGLTPAEKKLPPARVYMSERQGERTEAIKQALRARTPDIAAMRRAAPSTMLTALAGWERLVGWPQDYGEHVYFADEHVMRVVKAVDLMIALGRIVRQSGEHPERFMRRLKNQLAERLYDQGERFFTAPVQLSLPSGQGTFELGADAAQLVVNGWVPPAGISAVGAVDDSPALLSVLYFGALLHDLAKYDYADRKAQGMQHPEYGAAELVPQLIARLPVSAEYRELIVWLVREHHLFGGNVLKKPVDAVSVYWLLQQLIGGDDPAQLSRHQLQQRLAVLFVLNIADKIGEDMRPERKPQASYQIMSLLYEEGRQRLQGVDHSADLSADDTPAIADLRRLETAAVNDLMSSDAFSGMTTAVQRYMGFVPSAHWSGLRYEMLAREIKAADEVFQQGGVRVLYTPRYNPGGEGVYNYIAVAANYELPQQRGFLAKLSAVLAAHGQDIWHMSINTDPKTGLIMDAFLTRPRNGRTFDPGAVQADLTKLILSKNTGGTVFPPETEFILKDAPRVVDTAVVWRPEKKGAVFQIYTHDRQGLTFLITSVLANEFGANIISYQSETHGFEAVITVEVAQSFLPEEQSHLDVRLRSILNMPVVTPGMVDPLVDSGSVPLLSPPVAQVRPLPQLEESI